MAAGSEGGSRTWKLCSEFKHIYSTETSSTEETFEIGQLQEDRSTNQRKCCRPSCVVPSTIVIVTIIVVTIIVMRVMHETSAVSDTKEMDKYDQTTVTPTTRLSVTRGWVEENNSTRNTMTTATREELMQSLANSSTSDYCGNVSVTFTDVGKDFLDNRKSIMPIVPGCKENSNGSEYRGNVSVTRNGKTCRRWDTGLSQWHRYRPELYPELVENYCRNPGGNEPGLWCYTTDPNTPQQYCINPACSAGTLGARL
uniref:Kringle domain-containing protein n=1 Tax=Branchiostoma floridae TaxID=7739 RepID=C3YZW5_BRAFL|eukprot:XP_002598374.1 hypothetical protein BRAFLDRAFT_69731 [Branchiostoma floridae]